GSGLQPPYAPGRRRVEHQLGLRTDERRILPSGCRHWRDGHAARDSRQLHRGRVHEREEDASCRPVHGRTDPPAGRCFQHREDRQQPSCHPVGRPPSARQQLRL
ncbi:hypothetical protein XPN_1090, partial [Xanthomonas arboricola pv. pruni MAFF 301427]